MGHWVGERKEDVMSDWSTRPTLSLLCLYPDLTLCQRTCATQRNLAVVSKLLFPKPILLACLWNLKAGRAMKGAEKGANGEATGQGAFQTQSQLDTVVGVLLQGQNWKSTKNTKALQKAHRKCILWSLGMHFRYFCTKINSFYYSFFHKLFQSNLV